MNEMTKLGLSLIGVMASMVWWMVSSAALNSYGASQGLNPHHSYVLFGKIWQDRKNPVRLHLIGLIVSTISLILCVVGSMASGHH